VGKSSRLGGLGRAWKGEEGEEKRERERVGLGRLERDEGTERRGGPGEFSFFFFFF
jgi:hypothetical protein